MVLLPSACSAGVPTGCARFHIEFHPTVEEMSSEAAAVLSLKASCSVRRGQEARWPSRLAEDTTAFSCVT